MRPTRHSSVCWLWAAGLVLAGSSLAAADEPPLPTTTQLTAHWDDLYRSTSSHGTLTMDIVTANWSRTLEMEVWSKGEDDALIVIRAPSKEAGTATLRTDEGLWNYAPRADRLMRIPSGLLSDGWMGSHFTNDDLMRESSWEKDFDTTLSWVEEDGTRYLMARSIPKKDAAVVYTRVDQLFTEDGWLPVRGRYYDGDDLVRTIAFSGVKELGGRRIPTVMEVVPTEAPDEHTRITYTTMEFDLQVGDDLFTARGLRRAAQR